MRERPILFSAPMVRAILSGTKTQTRRIVKCPPATSDWVVSPERDGKWWPTDGSDYVGDGIACPYGAPGDRLWVRETWRTAIDLDRLSPAQICDKCIDAGYPKPWAPLKYADDVEVNRFGLRGLGDAWGKARASIHMPRWASRITLEITGVRVERLHAITDADAIAEGARRFVDIPDPSPYKRGPRWSMESPASTDECLGSPRWAFANLWIKINGQWSWDANPWVWVVEFRRVDAGRRAA